MNKLIAVLTLLTLAGCAPMVQVSTPRTVMISNVSKFAVADALRMAEAECAKYNRHAVYVPDNVLDGNLTYECKD